MVSLLWKKHDWLWPKLSLCIDKFLVHAYTHTHKQHNNFPVSSLGINCFNQTASPMHHINTRGHSAADPFPVAPPALHFSDSDRLPAGSRVNKRRDTARRTAGLWYDLCAPAKAVQWEVLKLHVMVVFKPLLAYQPGFNSLLKTVTAQCCEYSWMSITPTKKGELGERVTFELNRAGVSSELEGTNKATCSAATCSKDAVREARHWGHRWKMHQGSRVRGRRKK